jgi:NAD(P)-dependent dehydrogenase (short-subunit alcohol dehydrogenase family)
MGAADRLAGRRAVVTGGARGIGRAIAQRLFRDGAEVIVADVDERNGEATAATIGATFRRLDVTSETDWTALAGDLEADGVAILVNNAGGLLSTAPLVEHPVDVFRATLELNVTSTFLGMRALIPLMQAAGRGTIVNVCSFSGLVGQPDAPAYQAAKAGVWLLTRNAALTYARDGVRVNAVSPSVIETPALTDVDDDRTAAFLARIPLQRAGTPEEVAAAVAYLVGEDATFVTGANLAVDGGYLA